MQKTKTIALALTLFLGVCITPVFAVTATDEEIITKAVETTVRSILQIIEDSRKNEATRADSTLSEANVDTTTEQDASSITTEDLLKNLNPEEQTTIQSLIRIEKLLNSKKPSTASNLKASLLDIPATTKSDDKDLRTSIEETIRNLNEQSKFSNDINEKQNKEEEIEVTPISPTLLRSSTEPLLQFSRSLTRKAIPATQTKNLLPTPAKESTTTAERIPAERYHRAAEESSTTLFSTQNLIALGTSLVFMIVAVVLFFIRFEEKLLMTNVKFKHLNSFRPTKNTNKQNS